MNKRVLLIIFLACSFIQALFSQKYLALVKDGLSNIRTDLSIDAPIIDTILPGSFIYIQKESSNWYRCFHDDGFRGYIHRSHVIMFDILEESEKCQKIREVLSKQIELDSLINLDWKNDSLSNIRDEHSLNSFHPITFEATKYICETKDLELFALFQKAMWENRGSAAEEPKFNFGKLVYCLDKEMILNLKGNWSQGSCLYWKGFFDQVIDESLDKSTEEKNRLRSTIDELVY